MAFPDRKMRLYNIRRYAGQSTFTHPRSIWRHARARERAVPFGWGLPGDALPRRMYLAD